MLTLARAKPSHGIAVACSALALAVRKNMVVFVPSWAMSLFAVELGWLAIQVGTLMLCALILATANAIALFAMAAAVAMIGVCFVIRMPLRAILGTMGKYRPLKILPHRDWLKVSRVDAGRIHAEMVEDQPVRDRANHLFIGEAMGRNTGVAIVEAPITFDSSPVPEPTRPGCFDLLPKAFGGRFPRDTKRIASTFVGKMMNLAESILRPFGWTPPDLTVHLQSPAGSSRLVYRSIPHFD